MYIGFQSAVYESVYECICTQSFTVLVCLPLFWLSNGQGQEYFWGQHMRALLGHRLILLHDLEKYKVLAFIW